MEVAPSMTISPNFLKTLGQNLKEPTSAFADFADNADDAFAKELHIWIDADHEGTPYLITSRDNGHGHEPVEILELLRLGYSKKSVEARAAAGGRTRRSQSSAKGGFGIGLKNGESSFRRKNCCAWSCPIRAGQSAGP